MDKKEARRILGVTKEAGRNDIERRYAILLKKHRMAAMQRERGDGSDSGIEAETGAGAGEPPVAGMYVPEMEATDGKAAVEEAGAAIDDAPAQRSDVVNRVAPDRMTDGRDGGKSALEAEAARDRLSVPEPGDEYDFDKITEAYNLLMGYEVKVKEEPPGKLSPLFGKLGIDEKKARNFLYYYKYHIIAVVLLIASVAYFVKGCVNRVEPDFNVAFIGKIGYFEAVDKLKSIIRENIPSIKEPGIDGAFITEGEIVGEQEYAMQMKATVLFAAGNIDVFILDRPNYERYAKQGVFVNLDDIAPRLGADMEENRENILGIEKDAENDLEEFSGEDGGEGRNGDSEETGGEDGDGESTEKHLYGISVRGSKVMEDAGVIGEDMVAAIFAGSSQLEKSEEFIKLLLKK